MYSLRKRTFLCTNVQSEEEDFSMYNHILKDQGVLQLVMIDDPAVF